MPRPAQTAQASSALVLLNPALSGLAVGTGAKAGPGLGVRDLRPRGQEGKCCAPLLEGLPGAR